MKRSLPLLLLLLSLVCLPGWAETNQRKERGDRTQNRPRRKEAIDRYFQRLEQQNPDEVNRLRELRRTDPEAFRQEMRSRLHKKAGSKRIDGLQDDSTIKDLVQEVKAAGSNEEYMASKAKLREAVTRRYEESVAAREQALTHMREKLAELEERHEREKGMRDRIVDRQVKRLLSEQSNRPGSRPASQP